MYANVDMPHARTIMSRKVRANLERAFSAARPQLWVTACAGAAAAGSCGDGRGRGFTSPACELVATTLRHRCRSHSLPLAKVLARSTEGCLPRIACCRGMCRGR
eukprot:COSAG06_NODE_430_length_15870_cov_101.914971_8_plen_104_part_00